MTTLVAPDPGSTFRRVCPKGYLAIADPRPRGERNGRRLRLSQTRGSQPRKSRVTGRTSVGAGKAGRETEGRPTDGFGTRKEREQVEDDKTVGGREGWLGL